MRQKFFFAVLALFLFAPAAARAQSQPGAPPDVDEHRAEVGAFYTGVNLQGFGETVNGLGGRFGYNFHKHFALDAGGVLELYPSSRAIVRFDAGDTVIRLRHTAAGGLLTLPPIAGDTTHNFQFSVGFGYRF